MNQAETTLPSVNQPQIKVDQQVQQPTSTDPIEQKSTNERNNPEHNEREEELKRSREIINQIRAKHPECIPVFYVKHEGSPKQFPSPKIPFILFKKQLKIEQAMYNLYNQIQIKGMYFFCTKYNQKQKKFKYIILQPGETIENVYKKYGKDGHLTIVYGDKNIGMGGVNKMEKWLMRIMFVLLSVWIFLYAYPMYLSYERDGFEGVWNVISTSLSGPRKNTEHAQNANPENPNSQQGVYVDDTNIGDEPLGRQPIQVSHDQPIKGETFQEI